MSDRIPKELSKRGGYYYDNELFYSKAYQTLTKTARNLLQDLINELRFVYYKIGRQKQKRYTNNGAVSFTEIQFKQRHGCTSATYLKARNQLLEVGLIKQTHKGGKCRGDMAKYKILFIKGVLQSERRWEQYPEKNWEQDIPKKKNNLVGKDTRWSKGQSGKKKKPTLLKYGLNGSKPPIKVYPYENKPPIKVYP